MPLHDPLAQYTARAIYSQIVAYSQQNNSEWRVYDAWTTLANNSSNPGPGRGFYLDLWDLWDTPAAQQRFPVKEPGASLLKSFICLRFEDFASIFKHSTPPESAWIDAVSLHLNSIATAVGNTGETKRRVYSLLYQYQACFADLCRSEGIEILDSQLAALERVRLCQESALFRIPVLYSNPQSQEAHDWVRLLALFYQRLDHFDQTPFDSLVQTLTSEVELKKGPRKCQKLTSSLVYDLLMHYAAIDDLVSFPLFAEKSDLAFTTFADKPVCRLLPESHGCDAYVAVLGPRGVGKTTFMLASNYALTANMGVDTPRLDIHHVNESTEGEKSKKYIDQLKQMWTLSVETIDQNQQNLYKTTGDPQLYAETDAVGLCKFRFFDIPGDYLGADLDPEIANWLKNHLQRIDPSALVLVIDIDHPQVDPYLRVLKHLLTPSHARSLPGPAEPRQAPPLSNIPVYFLFNKVDRLINSLAVSADPLELKRLRKHLNCEQEIFTRPVPRAFLSLRDLASPLKKAQDAVSFVERLHSLCREQALLSTFRSALERVSDLLDMCLKAGLSDCSFFFANCLWQPAPDGESPHSYHSLETLWRDIRRRVTEGSADARGDFLKEEFITGLDSGFARLAALAEKGNLSQDASSVSVDISHWRTLASLDGHEPNGMSGFMQAAIDTVKKYPESSEVFESRCDKSFGAAAIRLEVERFKSTRNKFRERVKGMIASVLEELGIPAKPIGELKGYTDLTRVEREKGVTSGMKPSRSYLFLSSPQFQAAVSKMTELINASIAEYATANASDIPNIDRGQIDSAIASLTRTLRELAEGEEGEIVHMPFDGLLTSRCIYRDRDLSTYERDLIGASAALSPIDALLTLERFKPLNAAPKQSEEPNVDEALRLAGILARYQPPREYAHLMPSLFEMDPSKPKVLNKLLPEIRQEERKLMGALRQLLIIWHHLADDAYPVDTVANRLIARYLLEALRLDNFNIDLFLKKPLETANAVQKCSGSLQHIAEKTYVPGFGKKSIDIGAVQAEAGAVRLGGVAISENSSGDDVTRESLRFAAAAAILARVQQLVPEVPETVFKLASGGVQLVAPVTGFNVIQLTEVDRMVGKYTEGWQERLVRERATYLNESGWLLQLSEAARRFVVQTLNGSQLEAEAGGAAHVRAERIKQAFVEGVADLIGEKPLWVG
jgi:hypothetical protein